MSKDNILTYKLDVQAIKEAGIDLEDQINKFIKFSGLVAMSSGGKTITGVFRNENYNDAKIRQIACEMYSIVFDLEELTVEDRFLLQELKLYIVLPEKMGVLESH
jgi:hypothetical protein